MRWIYWMFSYSKLPIGIDVDTMTKGHIMMLINFWVNTNIMYKEDTADNIWQTPQQTINLGTGDCEDYAILKYFIARSYGIEDCKLVVGIIPDRRMHHMVVLYDGVVFDNMVLYGIVSDICNVVPAYAFNHNGTYLINVENVGFGVSEWVDTRAVFPLTKWDEVIINEYKERTTNVS